MSDLAYTALIMQILTLAVALYAAVFMVLEVIFKRLSWLLVVLPMIYLVILIVFVAHRIIYKVDLLPLPDSLTDIALINTWSVGIHFLSALMVAVAVTLVWLNSRVNGNHE